MTKEFKYLKEGVTKDLVGYVMEDYGVSLTSALDTVYESETFKKLSEPQTGLYLQGSKYVYDYLQNELKTGIMS